MTGSRIIMLVLVIAVFVTCMIMFITTDKYIPKPSPPAPATTTEGTPR